ncbi:hypothetical protein EDB81DRAFT_713041 [Dactylonectria macrodidyma]|uniref:Protein NO VEIN C-terminal domain-containing protein n=1 Tax=Dactylonectria macrodidyma TaxID=307937 RepID=A0A9P9FNL9_9HYPO|nr:hypothetical protein EDB81DRAFT_713041 [Dactylonectria macrodidyma]
MASIQEAEQIVRRLTRKYGFLNEKMMDDIEQFNSDYRREIDENWLAMESAVSHSVKILAKQIYGSGARFVFELLQNAEDNAFEKTTVFPFITFKMHPNHIVVDCNEDGFTERDLQAICAVGQSTKSASHGYIGAKGIGFKSVFIAASRVHIQSGNFSFEFRHNKTDPGIGMVRPIWVSPVETIPEPLTRMTLYLHDQGDQGEIQHLKRIISMQFDELQETCLLFLQKLRKISVEFYDENGELERSKQFRKWRIDEHRVSLETTSIIHGEETNQSQIYHITKQTATGLAWSDNRELPDTDEARRISSTAEVVLAFPLTSDSKPLVTRKKQDLFAFLPLRKSDYKFLIHSDFDTNANRQDIVTTSRRNLDLRSWIAIALFQAILQFCEHPTLCYDWPGFLPSLDDSSDAFWSGLNHEIEELMKKRPVLRSRNRSDLRLISDIRILSSDASDRDGQPVFDDPAKDLFLSPHYPRSTMNILKEYGLRSVTVDILENLLETDLRSANSKMHAKDTTDEWHSVVARMLSRWFENKLQITERLKTLPLLPLRDEAFTSIASGPVYFSVTGDIDIPHSLDLRIISLSASKNSDRTTLFLHLGVSKATTDQVRASIFRSFVSHSTFKIWFLKSYLKYLYLTHQPGTHSQEDYAKVKVATDGLYVRAPCEKDVYLPGTKNAYSPASLLAAQSTAPGLPVEFLHSYNMEDELDKPNSSHPSWEEWLCGFLGIRDRLRLLSRNGDALSDTFLYVFEHRPEEFLGLFEHLWLHEKSELLRKRTLRNKIEDLPAKQLCGVNFSLKLKEAWLPFENLRASVKRYMEHPEQFPFLKFEDSDISQRFGTKWNFLNEYFSVGKDDSMDFLLEILRCVERSCPKPSTGQSQKVFDLYVAIYSKLAVANDQPEARRKIRAYFEERGVLGQDEEAPMWTFSSRCLWVAPPDMTTAHSLRILYSRMLGEVQMRSIENLFQTTLELSNASLNDLVTELEALREAGCEDKRRIWALYKYLDENTALTFDLRAAFEASRLIYHETRPGESRWYKTSDCVWSSETAIRGKAILDGCWEGRKSFFVGKLGVKLLTLQMVYDELRQSPESSVDDIKTAILLLNGFLDTEPTRLDPEPIRRAKIFPVRYPNGTVALTSVDVDFAIGDRNRLKAKFQDQISLLDFGLDDVRLLKPAFEWLSLQDRYLSNAVTETTSISSNPGRPISSRNRDLKRKAYYITRVASTFHSPRFQYDQEGLYEQLRTMTVIEIEGISSVLEIFQNRQSFQVEVTTANVHIDDETSEELTIYVPKKRREREFCFCSVLPRKLAAWLMRHPTSLEEGPVEIDAVIALTSIFACDQSVLDDILDYQGILQVTFENEDEGHDDEDEDEVEDEGREEEQEQEQQQSDNPLGTEDSSSEQQMTPTHSSVNDSLSPQVGLSDAEPERGLTETEVEIISRQSHLSNHSRPGGRDDSSRPALIHLPSQSPSDSSPRSPRYLSSTVLGQPQSRSSEDAHYLAILNRVIEKARRAAFPSRGAFDMSDLRGALSGGAGNSAEHESFDGLDVMSRFRSTNQLERDKKIGAAGELYVFELLSQLDIPGWDRANWQSTIRAYVTIHPDYTNMAPWNRRETADLVYVDTAGHFTDTLIGCGYLNHDQWHGARPKYYIEVKTTTGPCDTPFYMSGNQYQLMGRIHHSEDRSEVYMIFRVFWLNSDRIGLCIYFDPEQLRQDGRLVFTGQTWSVTPGVGTEADN